MIGRKLRDIGEKRRKHPGWGRWTHTAGVPGAAPASPTSVGPIDHVQITALEGKRQLALKHPIYYRVVAAGELSKPHCPPKGGEGFVTKLLGTAGVQGYLGRGRKPS